MTHPYALTLWQPWADLVALGMKRIETRSWSTSYRGTLYIHAAKRKVDEDDVDDLVRPVRDALRMPGASRLRGAKTFGDWIRAMPLGAIVAVCDLVDCVRTETVFQGLFIPVDAPPERYFGNYEPGRWAWKLENIRLVEPAVPCQGDRQLWIPTPRTIDAVLAALAGEGALAP